MNDVQLFNIISMLSGIIVGGLVTWYFSRKYYQKSTVDLIRGLENSGLVEANRNKNGKIIGYKIKLAGKSQSHSTVLGELSVKHSSLSRIAGFEMPVGFDVASYDQAYDRVSLITKPTDPNDPLKVLKKNSHSSYISAWKGLAIRMRSTVEYDQEFRQLIVLNTAPPLEERYSQERALFGCVASALSAIDCFYMAVYCVAAVLCPSCFALLEAKHLKKYPMNVAKAYGNWLSTDSFSLLLLQVASSDEFEELKGLRDALAHRGVLPRKISLSEKPSTMPSNPKDLAEHFDYATSLNDETTSIHTLWLRQTTSKLVSAFNDFLVRHPEVFKIGG